MQPLNYEPPTALMRGLCDALHCGPPPSRWSPGGVFLGDLVDRYLMLAGRLRRQGEPDAMSACQHADWFTSLAVDHLPTDSLSRVFSDLQLWEEAPGDFDALFRDVINDRVHGATMSFIETVSKNR
jgi:hypothetical protein